jgi:hypothetical protein
MTNAQRIYAQTCRHLQAVQANIDRLAELNANEELALLAGRLKRLAFRAAPARLSLGKKITVHGGNEQMFGAEEQVLGRG